MLKKWLPWPKSYYFLLFLTATLSLYTAFFSHMNNWLIFRASFYHLMEGTSLYQLYPSEHHDLYKYSPTFALFMAPLSLLPAWLGGVLWNLLGAWLWILGSEQMELSNQQKSGLFWICLPEFIGSTQGFQSNIHLVAGLMFFWGGLEKKQAMFSNLSLLGTFFIKIFGLIGGVLSLYAPTSFANPRFFIKGILSFILLLTFFLLLPLPFIGWESFIYQYQEWLRLLKEDAAQSYGFSLMGIVYGVTKMPFERLPWQIAGGLSLVGTILYHRNGDRNIRWMGFIALCYFLVLFNHKSESPTFIIAMVGFALHQSLIVNPKLRWSLIVFTLGCVSLMYSDLFKGIKQSVLDPYAVKVWPFVLLYPMALFNVGTKKRVSIASKD